MGWGQNPTRTQTQIHGMKGEAAVEQIEKGSRSRVLVTVKVVVEGLVEGMGCVSALGIRG